MAAQGSALRQEMHEVVQASQVATVGQLVQYMLRLEAMIDQLRRDLKPR